MAEADSGTTAGDECGTVGEVVNGAEVAPEHYGGVVEKAGSVRLFDAFETVQQSCEQVAVCGIAFLGGLLTFTGAVVAHVVCGHFDPKACE